MKDALIIVGPGSHILRDYEAKKSYSALFKSNRLASTLHNNSTTLQFEFDLLDSSWDSSELVWRLEEYDEIDIVFSAYVDTGLTSESSLEEVKRGLLANCGQPIHFLNSVSRGLPAKRIRGVFISSIYAHVAPIPDNYEVDSQINPLYYGVSKAGVEQGLRWLSVQNIKHTFNSIVLGPMPKPSVLESSPVLVECLKSHMSSDMLIKHQELHALIDYMLGCGESTRGVSYQLDGGYLCY